MTFNKLRKYYILISQLLGASYCIYFILNVKHYEVSWRLLSWVMPNVVIRINALLSSIGTFILVIPLTIIIMSLLIPESYKLKIASTFFGTATTLFMIISGFFRNTLGEAYNMGILLITKILSLEEKQAIFKNTFQEIIEAYRTNLKMFNHLDQLLLEKYFTIYNTKLTLLKEPLAVKLYAHEIIEYHKLEFQNTVMEQQYSNYMMYFKYILYAGAGIAITLIAFAIIRACMDTNEMIEGAKLARETAMLTAKGNAHLLDTQETAQEAFKITRELCIELVKVAVDMQSEQLNVAFQKVDDRLTALDQGMDTLTQILDIKKD